MESAIATGRAERKRKDTERGGTERKRRDATSPLAAAVAEGGMTVRRATATGGTNTRRARGARRAKRPVRKSVQTKRTRRPWSSDLSLLSICLHTLRKGRKWPTKPESRGMIDAACHSPLHQSPFASILLSFVLTITSEWMEQRRRRGDGQSSSSSIFPSVADISQSINQSSATSFFFQPFSQSSIRSCSEISLYSQDDQQNLIFFCYLFVCSCPV